MAEKTKRRIIEVTSLTKKYKKATTEAVSGVSFYVEEGSFFSLLGPNGAGKTTIISVLTTLLTSTSGKATIGGHDVNREADKVRQDIGVIFQNPSLDLNLTAEENIRFHANLYNLYPYMPSFALMPIGYQKQVKELAKILGLEGELNRPVKTLSGGMKRKLEIIRSLMHKPKVLFLDEPTTGLDPVSRRNLWQYLQQIRKTSDITIFLTTHYLEEAEGSDYLCIIDKGTIVAKGTPGDIKKTLVEKFILVNGNNPSELSKELRKHRLNFTGTGPFKIILAEKNPQAVINLIKTKLTTLEIHNPTLEEAYVEIIRRGNEHN